MVLSYFEPIAIPILTPEKNKINHIMSSINKLRQPRSDLIDVTIIQDCWHNNLYDCVYAKENELKWDQVDLTIMSKSPTKKERLLQQLI